MKLFALALTVGIGATGAGAFWVLGMPAAFLTGSAIAVTIAVALRLPTNFPPQLRDPNLAILGVMMGAGVTPDTLGVLAELPLAILGLAVAVAGATAASFAVLRGIGRWDGVTAMCGSIPGALQLTLAVAVSSGAQMDKVVMAQGLRLLILVSLVPMVFGGGDGPQHNIFAPPDATWLDVALTLALAAAFLGVAKLLRAPSGALVLPLCASAILSGTGVMTIAVPDVIGALAFILLGASVAVRFKGMEKASIVPTAVLSLGAFVAAFTVAVSMAASFSTVLHEPLGAVFLAYAPGGVDAMIALAFLLGFDVAFVAVLHVARLIMLIFAGPVLVAWMRRRADPPA